ncbi:DUF4064 domain-containing protein [Staphylococcus arlettae]|uniref:Membrane protein n=3 Tax=Staphylococcus arlettae TaxID=29378 RepID=A0A2T7BRX0_9STAP|nr:MULTISPECIES: DUF4064 domain-containing protein [Staphylococcus]EJY94501.1 hypothetical protein SARL_10661 [Staphylococcus arlettae CVD059]ERF49317.1 hypothetical protein N039_10540 [Staphylococcus sp. EGD-HP3]KAB2477109.1 DUF4064 domain-containing protein [Staphylococcus sp. CH99b_3]MBF0738613.1 DUF4064 domain-containing protein [Staphylococcus arlettae]MBK3719818.1 hypothetical protein [Staphylococcus arlettae]
MKLKAEKIMAWIANGLSILYVIIVIFGLFLLKSNTQEFQAMFDEITQQQGQTISTDMMYMSYIIQVVALVIVSIIAIIATLIMKANRVLAASLFIVVAIISLFVSNLVAMVLWLIVAIRLFTKKKNKNDGTRGQFTKENSWNPEEELKDKKNDPYIY